MPASTIRTARLCAFVLVSACAGTAKPRQVGPSEARVLTESQALLVIQEQLAREGALVKRKVPLEITEGEKLEVDVRFGQAPFAIEWVTDEDRAAHAGALPRNRPDGPLRVITARDKDATAQVLVLDSDAYRYEGNPQLVQRGAPSIEDAESRVRRDVTDFLEYVRGQGAL